jgi:hypothetical protein
MRRLGLCIAVAALVLAAPAAPAQYSPRVMLQDEPHDHAAYPDLGRVTAAERRNGRVLLAEVGAAARARFPTLAAARRLGFREGPPSRFLGMRPGAGSRSPFVHYRNSGYAHDGRVLDPARPEALVYWERESAAPVLVGFMFRASSLRPPPDPHRVGRLLGWHAHARCDPAVEPGNPLQFRTAACPSGIAHHGESQMTHAWLARSLRSGFAEELPARRLGIHVDPALYAAHDHGGHGHHHGAVLTAGQAAVANAWAVSLAAPLGALLLLARGGRRQAPLRLLGILALAGVAVAHAVDLGAHVDHAPYLAVLFCALIAACALLALALAVEWRTHAAWAAAVAASAGAIGGYVVSRTVGLPGIADHVGDWGEPAAVAAIVCEAAVVALGCFALWSAHRATGKSKYRSG